MVQKTVILLIKSWYIVNKNVNIYFKTKKEKTMKAINKFIIGIIL